MRSSRISWCLGLVFACLGLPEAAFAADGVWSRSSGWQVSWDDDHHGCTAMNVSQGQEFVELTVSGKGSKLLFFSRSWAFIRTGEKYRVSLVFDGRSAWGGDSVGLVADGVFGFAAGASSGLLKDFAKRKRVSLFVDGNRQPLASYSLSGSFRALAETTECAKALERGGLQNLSAGYNDADLW